MRLPSIVLIAFSVSALTSAQSPPNPSREAELAAVASADFPYAGFWKPYDCTPGYGLAISPAGTTPGLYSVSFCGPGGCFEPGTYRPNTTLVNDEKYWVIDENTIEVRGCGKLAHAAIRYVRCPGREVP
jgi:hypothetical protein